MGDFRSLRGLTMVATVCVGLYLVTTVIAAVLTWMAPLEADDLGSVGMAVLLDMLMTLICVGVVGRWIYVASRNAHQLSGDLSISPGWAVGWYFVPFANLVKPLEAMRETWSASTGDANQFNSRTPAILGWWWGLWLATNILGNASFQVTRLGADPSVGATIGLVVGLLTIPLCWLLISIMRQVSAGQEYHHYAEAFA